LLKSRRSVSQRVWILKPGVVFWVGTVVLRRFREGKKKNWKRAGGGTTGRRTTKPCGTPGGGGEKKRAKTTTGEEREMKWTHLSKGWGVCLDWNRSKGGGKK